MTSRWSADHFHGRHDLRDGDRHRPSLFLLFLFVLPNRHRPPQSATKSVRSQLTCKGTVPQRETTTWGSAEAASPPSSYAPNDPALSSILTNGHDGSRSTRWMSSLKAAAAIVLSQEVDSMKCTLPLLIVLVLYSLIEAEEHPGSITSRTEHETITITIAIRLSLRPSSVAPPRQPPPSRPGSRQRLDSPT